MSNEENYVRERVRGGLESLKGEKPLKGLNEKNEFYVNSYLYKKKKQSDKTYRSLKTTLKILFSYFGKPAHQITKIEMIEFLDEVLDKRDIKLSSKNQYRSNLRGFFEYIEAMILHKHPNFVNPVPKKNIYKFTQKSDDIRRKGEKKRKVLKIKEIERILIYCRKNLDKEHFIMLGLLACTGARQSEIRTIKIKDINLDGRYFETGFEKNARKSTLGTKESLLFFFPERFGIYLRNYILELNNEYLFPSPEDGRLPYFSGHLLHYYVKKIRKKICYFEPHYFRHSLITHFRKNGCDRDKSEMLTNHVPTGTQGKYYVHLEPLEKREIYDKYFPYYSIKYF